MSKTITSDTFDASRVGKGHGVYNSSSFQTTYKVLYDNKPFVYQFGPAKTSTGLRVKQGEDNNKKKFVSCSFPLSIPDDDRNVLDHLWGMLAQFGSSELGMSRDIFEYATKKKKLISQPDEEGKSKGYKDTLWTQVALDRDNLPMVYIRGPDKERIPSVDFSRVTGGSEVSVILGFAIVVKGNTLGYSVYTNQIDVHQLGAEWLSKPLFVDNYPEPVADFVPKQVLSIPPKQEDKNHQLTSVFNDPTTDSWPKTTCSTSPRRSLINMTTPDIAPVTSMSLFLRNQEEKKAVSRKNARGYTITSDIEEFK